GPGADDLDRLAVVERDPALGDAYVEVRVGDGVLDEDLGHGAALDAEVAVPRAVEVLRCLDRAAVLPLEEPAGVAAGAVVERGDRELVRQVRPALARRVVDGDLRALRRVDIEIRGCRATGLAVDV